MEDSGQPVYPVINISKMGVTNFKLQLWTTGLEEDMRTDNHFSELQVFGAKPISPFAKKI